MFVVRTDPISGGEPTYKALKTLSAARQRLHTLGSLVRHGMTAGVFLFNVPGEKDAWRAIEAVRNGSGVFVERDPWGAREHGQLPITKGPGDNPDA
jgi:hypothetical protein